MREARRFAIVVLLLLVGFGMVALADALQAWWPLFLTPVPYAAIPWLLVNAPPKSAPGSTEPT